MSISVQFFAKRMLLIPNECALGNVKLDTLLQFSGKKEGRTSDFAGLK